MLAAVGLKSHGGTGESRECRLTWTGEARGTGTVVVVLEEDLPEEAFRGLRRLSTAVWSGAAQRRPCRQSGLDQSYAAVQAYLH
jgi:hypothetical protein